MEISEADIETSGPIAHHHGRVALCRSHTAARTVVRTTPVIIAPNSPITLGAVVLVALGASTWMVGRIRALGLMDHPNTRSSHSIPTPRGGGAAIVALTLLGFATLMVSSDALPLRKGLGYLLAAAILSVISLLDDMRSLSAPIRLSVHGLCALTIVFTSGYVSEVMAGGITHHLGLAGAALTWLWIIGLTNAYNFMDGVDGLAGAQAVVGGLGWAILGALSDEPSLVWGGVLIATTTLGFLRYNWPPARIFMGDVGSAFLGFSFAVFPMLSEKEPSSSIVPAVLLVWPFLFDTSLTLIRRLTRQENIFAAHRSHLYQRLNVAGYSHGWISTLYAVFAFEGAVAAIAFPRASGHMQIAIVVGVTATAIIYWRFVLHVERSVFTAFTEGSRTD